MTINVSQPAKYSAVYSFRHRQQPKLVQTRVVFDFEAWYMDYWQWTHLCAVPLPLLDIAFQEWVKG